MSCEDETRCVPCLSYSYCMFVILIGGKGICVHKAQTVYIDVATIIYSSRDCDFDSDHYVQRFETESNHSEWVTFDVVQKWDMPISQEQLDEKHEQDKHVKVKTPSDIEMEHRIVRSTLCVNSVDLEDTNGAFAVIGWVRLEWLDQKLATTAWLVETGAELPLATKRTDYQKDDIWWPRILVDNNQDIFSLLTGTWPLRADDVGQITWNFPVELLSRCRIDMSRWPSDIHTCNFTLFIASRLHENSLELMDKIVFQDFKVGYPWTLVHFEVKRSEGQFQTKPDLSVALDYVFTVQRDAMFLTLIYKCPIYVVTVISTCLLLMDSRSEVRTHIVIFLFLYLTSFLMYFAYKLPYFGFEISLIVLLYGWNWVLITIMLLMEVIGEFFPSSREPPRFLQRLSPTYLIRCFRVFQLFPFFIFTAVSGVLIFGMDLMSLNAIKSSKIEMDDEF